MTTLKEHIAFLQTLGIPFKGTLIEYLKHVYEQHYDGRDNTMNDPTEKMSLHEFVKACLQAPPQVSSPAPLTPAPLPAVQKANEAPAKP